MTHPLHEQIVLLNAGFLFELSGDASSLEEGSKLPGARSVVSKPGIRLFPCNIQDLL